MKRLSGPRKTANLSDSVHHRLNMYALAAGAAGVGVLALAQPAESKIVYTSAHRNLPLDKTFYLDLNHDGKNDFEFLLRSIVSTSEPFWRNTLKVEGLRGDQVLSFASNSFRYACASALPKGMRVGPKQPFRAGSLYMFFASSSFTGYGRFCPWLNVKTNAYLGVKFSINGKVHFGWARFGKISPLTFPPTAELTGYAYETIANKPIVTGRKKGAAGDPTNEVGPDASLTSPVQDAPQPATLGALAMGAPGLSIWRREELAVEDN
jgi:hypothetical protein